MEYGPIKLVIFTKEISLMIKKMDTANTNGAMAIYTKENSLMISDKEKGLWSGMTIVHIKESGGKDYPMEKVTYILLDIGMFKMKGEKTKYGYF